MTRTRVAMWVSLGFAAVAGSAGCGAPPPESWEYGELGVDGNGRVWWEEGSNEARTQRLSGSASIGLLATKLGATAEVTHSTGIVNLLAEKGWEPVMSTGGSGLRILFRRRRK